LYWVPDGVVRMSPSSKSNFLIIFILFWNLKKLIYELRTKNDATCLHPVSSCSIVNSYCPYIGETTSFCISVCRHWKCGPDIY
jgi:hypothetical protein